MTEDLVVSTPEKEKRTIVDIEICDCSVSPDYSERLYVSKFPDTDGTYTYIPKFVTLDKNGQPDDYVRERMSDYGNETVNGDLKLEQRERFVYCLETLKLPILLATHIAFNKPDLDLNEFEKPDEDAPATIFFGFYGPTMVGKTALVAMTSLRYGFPTATIDCFSGDTPEVYKELLLANTKDKDQLTIEEAVMFFSGKMAVPNEVRKHRLKPKPKPMHAVLDDLLIPFKGKDRPWVVLMDTPGRSSWFHSIATGKADDPKEDDIFDAVAICGLEDTQGVYGGHMISKMLRITDFEVLINDFPRRVKMSRLNARYERHQILSALKEKPDVS